MAKGFRVLFFAEFRERIGTGEMLVELDSAQTVADLCKHLVALGEPYKSVLGESSGSVKVAINQAMAQLDSPIVEGDEIAFFPPVTGG